MTKTVTGVKRLLDWPITCPRIAELAVHVVILEPATDSSRPPVPWKRGRERFGVVRPWVRGRGRPPVLMSPLSRRAGHEAARNAVDPAHRAAEHGQADAFSVPVGPQVAGAVGARAMTDSTWVFPAASSATGETGVLLRSRNGDPPVPVPIRHELVLGRDDACDVILATPLVSRRHARVWTFDGRFGLEDLASSNGTYV